MPNLPAGVNALAPVAAALVDAAAVAVIQQNCLVAKPGVGVYTVSLQAAGVNPGSPAGNPLPSNESVFVVAIKGALPGQVVVEDTSDFVKTVRTFDGVGVAADRAFDLVIARLPENMIGQLP